MCAGVPGDALDPAGRHAPWRGNRTNCRLRRHASKHLAPHYIWHGPTGMTWKHRPCPYTSQVRAPSGPAPPDESSPTSFTILGSCASACLQCICVRMRASCMYTWRRTDADMHEHTYSCDYPLLISIGEQKKRKGVHANMHASCLLLVRVSRLYGCTSGLDGGTCPDATTTTTTTTTQLLCVCARKS